MHTTDMPVIEHAGVIGRITTGHAYGQRDERFVREQNERSAVLGRSGRPFLIFGESVRGTPDQKTVRLAVFFNSDCKER